MFKQFLWTSSRVYVELPQPHVTIIFVVIVITENLAKSHLPLGATRYKFRIFGSYKVIIECIEIFQPNQKYPVLILNNVSVNEIRSHGYGSVKQANSNLELYLCNVWDGL